MNASFIRERQRYSTVVTAGPLSTHHMILFAVPVWKNIFSSAGTLRIKNELLPVMPKGWADKEVHKHCFYDDIANNLSGFFEHPSTRLARSPLPNPVLKPAEGVSLNRWGWRHFNNSRLAQNGIIWALSVFTSMTRRSIFRAALLCDRLGRRQPDETLTSARSLWSDKWEMCHSNMNALRRKHLAFSDSGSSPADVWLWVLHCCALCYWPVTSDRLSSVRDLFVTAKSMNNVLATAIMPLNVQ